MTRFSPLHGFLTVCSLAVGATLPAQAEEPMKPSAASNAASMPFRAAPFTLVFWSALSSQEVQRRLHPQQI